MPGSLNNCLPAKAPTCCFLVSTPTSPFLAETGLPSPPHDPLGPLMSGGSHLPWMTDHHLGGYGYF
jgi:hypothetical protein